MTGCKECGSECNNCGINCGACSKPKGCTPNCLEIAAIPFEPCAFAFMFNGCKAKLELNTAIAACETDTRMVQDQETGCIKYYSELYITSKGEQGELGQICPPDIAKFIDLEDLKNVEDDKADGCALLVYVKNSNCGEGCQGVDDQWVHWTASAHTETAIHYVMGFNEEGCPIVLDVPTDVEDFWYGMWVPNEGFMYKQPKEVDSIPVDEDGDPIVISQDPDTKEPVVGSIGLSCMFANFAKTLGAEVFGTFSVVQATPNFGAVFNPANGKFTITWNDWISAEDKHVGTGKVYGTVDFSYSFDIKTGSMTYHIHSIHYDRVAWTVDDGAGDQGPIKITLKGITVPGGAQTTLLNARSYSGNESWSQDIDRTIGFDQTVTVKPGETKGPFNFVYIWLDWVADDEGYLQLNFRNKFEDWTNCK